MKRLRAVALALGCMLAGQAQSENMAPSGTLRAVMEYDPSYSPAATVYRPRDMEAAADLPIVAWGNSACQANGGAYARRFLLELASHGYVIVAPGTPGPDPKLAPTSNRDPSPRLPAVAPGNDETQASELTAAIDWAIGENSRPGSIYRGRLDTRKVAVMGHSCGGLQALSVQGDPRIGASMIWNSGIYDRPAGRVGVRPTKDQLTRIHAPILYAQGGPTDIAYAAVNDDCARLPSGVSAVLIETNTGHDGTLRQQRGGSYAVIARAWLAWQLKGDKSAARMFVEPDCILCADRDFKISRRDLD